MSEHVCTVTWRRAAGEPFTDHRYSRAHDWLFDGGARVPASVSPHIVRPPYADVGRVDPEEGFLAALASCHMLFVLHLAAGRGWVVDGYDCTMAGDLVPGEDGLRWMPEARMAPVLTFAGAAPELEAIRALHAEAHRQCFLARSVKTRIRIDLDRQAALA